MKCIKRNDGQESAIRVRDFVAEEKVKSGEYKYVNKQIWKKEGRVTKYQLNREGVLNGTSNSRKA